VAPLETEVKFHITDSPAVRQRIIALGAESGGRIFESNATYEDASQSLKPRGMLLRLRRTENRNTLTLKAPPPEASTEFKVVTELETMVADPDAMHAVLERLGYSIWRGYEKWRETFGLEDVSFCLDAMPFGDFLEIEGPGDRIRALAAELGLDWSKRILINYYGIFDVIRAHMGLTFNDITFDRFEGIAVDMAAVAEQIAAG
jgi:adenylate cyclase class 2